MSEEKALLAAIWESPHDDTPRLVYADWLQENGQPERAEFIRVQIELARMDEWDESPRKAELEKREQAFWKKHAKAWKAGLSSSLQKRAGFHRGFPNPPMRQLPSSDFLNLTLADVAGAPLWGFHLPTNHKLLPKLLASPLLRRVGALDFRHWLESADDVRQFVSSPNVRNITDLNLGYSGFRDEGVIELAAGAAALPHLRRLNLEGNSLTARALESLVTAPLADGLRELRLFLNAIGSDGVLALANSPRLAWLERLDLSGCEGFGDLRQPISREAVTALFRSPHLRALKDLSLDPNQLGDRGVRMMCETEPVFRLAALRVSSILDPIGDAGAKRLAAWSALADVKVLRLYGNNIGAAGALALSR